MRGTLVVSAARVDLYAWEWHSSGTIVPTAREAERLNGHRSAYMRTTRPLAITTAS